MKAKPGEVWLADLGLAAKPRPVVIVCRHDPNPPRVLATYVPLTTQYRGSRYEIELGKLPFLDHPSYANTQGIGSLVEARLERKLGQLPEQMMAKIKDALRFALDL
jgi:mRNA interferase MazF